MNCKESSLSTDQLLKNSLRFNGALTGLAITAVTGYTDPIPCSLKHLSFDELLRASFGTDSCGKPALRVKFIATCDTLINCQNRSNENQLGEVFAYNSSTRTIAIVLNQSV
jgi:hypothetical protein